MMDDNEVDGKRKMIQVLMGVLKKSAGDEVSNGIGGSSQHKELTHTPIPANSVADHPHKKETFAAGAPKAHEPKANLESTEPNLASQGSLASQVMPGMKDGGMVDLSEPNRKMMQPASDDMKMADGGMPSPTDEPERVMESEAEHRPDTTDALEVLPEKPMDEQGSEASQQDEHNKENEEEDQNNNSSAFDAFFPRKKKK